MHQQCLQLKCIWNKSILNTSMFFISLQKHCHSQYEKWCLSTKQMPEMSFQPVLLFINIHYIFCVSEKSYHFSWSISACRLEMAGRSVSGLKSWEINWILPLASAVSEPIPTTKKWHPSVKLYFYIQRESDRIKYALNIQWVGIVWMVCRLYFT